MKRFEPATLIGLLIGVTAIGLSLLIDGTKPRFLWQPTALLVVFGGTLGAIIVRSGLSGLRSALAETARLFRKEDEHAEDAMIARLAWLARNSRREGQRVLENYANVVNDKLVSRGLLLTCEYADPTQVRSALNTLLDEEDQEGLRKAAILDAAGGYAPTFGILGAVLGLVHVLRSLDNPSELGTGIATAFVATIYGVGVANLLLFPLAARLRERHQLRIRRREAVADALVAISAHESPARIKQQFAINS